MYLDKINYIFIHNEKCGGNFISRNFIKNDLSSAKIVKKSHDDGFNEFQIFDKYSSHKHHSLKEYFDKFKEKSKNLKVITNIRDPLDRLISYYFGPSHNMKTIKLVKKINYQLFKFFKTNMPFSYKFYWYVQPKYSRENFIDFMNSVKSQKEKFLYNNNYIMPDYIIYFHNLNSDLQKFLDKFDKKISYNKPVNVNNNKLSINKEIIYEDKIILNKFKNSKHFEDYYHFNIPINKHIL